MSYYVTKHGLTKSYKGPVFISENMWATRRKQMVQASADR